jgi:hypothetical protein
MSRTIEANFFPQAFEAIKDKPSILIVDDNHDVTRAAKLALEKSGRYFVSEENDATKPSNSPEPETRPILLNAETDGGEVVARN